MLGCGRSAVTAIQGPPRTASRATWANEHSFALLASERAGATAPAGTRVALTVLLVPVTLARSITLRQKLCTELLIGEAAAATDGVMSRLGSGKAGKVGCLEQSKARDSPDSCQAGIVL